MTISLISQILTQNEYVQQLPAERGPSSLLNAFRRIKQLAAQLNQASPRTIPYCVAFTILANCAETELKQVRYYYERSLWDGKSRTPYALAFERLQYQTNLAVSLLV